MNGTKPFYQSRTLMWLGITIGLLAADILLLLLVTPSWLDVFPSVFLPACALLTVSLAAYYRVVAHTELDF